MKDFAIICNYQKNPNAIIPNQSVGYALILSAYHIPVINECSGNFRLGQGADLCWKTIILTDDILWSQDNHVGVAGVGLDCTSAHTILTPLLSANIK